MSEAKVNKLFAIVGMTGSGKTTLADYLVKRGFLFLRMGQITLDEIKRRGLEPTEENERPIREEFRRVHGMGAFAILNLPKIDELLKRGNVVIDNVMSWSEYKEFEKRYGDDFVCIAVLAGPRTRYARLTSRRFDPKNDPQMRFREASFEQARSRDFAEIEHIEKGGPIVMAQYYIVNEGSNEDLIALAESVLEKLSI